MGKSTLRCFRECKEALNLVAFPHTVFQAIIAGNKSSKAHIPSKGMRLFIFDSSPISYFEIKCEKEFCKNKKWHIAGAGC